jgi:hypothetical protein
MDDKIKALLDDFLDKLPEKDKTLFKSIAEYAISLNYLPKKTKTRVFNIDFINSKIKRTLLKLEAPDTKKQDSISGIRLKFYANKDYSDIFKEAIKRVIEESDGRYTGCYGCGKCSGELEGYFYVYSDGKRIFRCGGELIPVIGWNENSLVEIKQLMNNQNDFWIQKCRN